ncbi:hypothetical protein CBCST_03861 [Clostridium botulinum C str. Stockholm]|nr:hypothetical protein CBCST_03861 [Clostridium botulinum C str. Stockholm]
MFNNKKILVLFLCMVSIAWGIPNKVFASTYKDMGKKSNIVLNKVWNIKFNKDIDATTINKKNIVVVDDKNNNVSINVKYKNSRQVEVSSINSYKPSSNYTMFINEDIKSTDGKKIKIPAKMEFLTEKST